MAEFIKKQELQEFQVRRSLSSFRSPARRIFEMLIRLEFRRYRMRRWYESILRPVRQVSRSSFLIQQRMWMTGRLCLHAAMKQQESQTKTIFRLQPAMVCGRRESDSRQAVRSLAQWQFRWDRVIQISRFR